MSVSTPVAASPVNVLVLNSYQPKNETYHMDTIGWLFSTAWSTLIDSHSHSVWFLFLKGNGDTRYFCIIVSSEQIVNRQGNIKLLPGVYLKIAGKTVRAVSKFRF